ncbi:copper transporter [Nanchangia anserum]|uniref:Copper transporter n=1 Tax=Nanchangia anserum TaxID=2692125 RepID=A0A8I0G6D8_9ACTO|nr:copper transporter [Nanchangia anserum]MBD3688637.1 copper transporter [Nanchangia anserum]QOX82398.1 copper transporter [Nanchangia anserum]
MIDFRYHLVSLMAVLVALTIGVILGAGPLQGPLSDTLTGQVDKLAERQSELTDTNARLDKAVTQGQEFIEGTSAHTVAGTLSDVPVALVRTSDASDSAVDDISRLLGAAGAKVTVTAQLEPAWFSEDGAATRSAVAKRASGYLGDAVSATSSDADVLSTALVRAMTTKDDNTTVLRDLLGSEDGKLVTISGSEPAQAVVLVTATHADLGQDTAEGKDETMIRSTTRVIGALDGSGLVAGDATSDKDFVSLVRHASVSVATTDSISTSRGRVSAILGLAAARAGKPAAFGTGVGATQLVPEVAAS